MIHPYQSRLAGLSRPSIRPRPRSRFEPPPGHPVHDPFGSVEQTTPAEPEEHPGAPPLAAPRTPGSAATPTSVPADAAAPASGTDRVAPTVANLKAAEQSAPRASIEPAPTVPAATLRPSAGRPAPDVHQDNPPATAGPGPLDRPWVPAAPSASRTTDPEQDPPGSRRPPAAQVPATSEDVLPPPPEVVPPADVVVRAELRASELPAADPDDPLPWPPSGALIVGSTDGAPPVSPVTASPGRAPPGQRTTAPAAAGPQVVDVQVRIDRVEVRSAAPAAELPARRRPAAASTSSLAEYLRRHQDGAGG